MAETVSKETEIGRQAAASDAGDSALPLRSVNGEADEAVATQDHPLASTLGVLKDHPMWPAVLEAIEEDRRRADQLFAELSDAAHLQDKERLLDAVARGTGSAGARAAAGIATSHPIAAMAGKYADEPLWDELLAAIENYRREVDEQTTAAE